jgi:hypothetical protein
MRPGYSLVRHPTPSEESEGWRVGYRISVHGVLAPEFSLHKSRIQECVNDMEYEELLCECADDLLQAQRDNVIGT